MHSDELSTARTLEQPLGDRFPIMFTGEKAIIFVRPEMSIRFVCDEFRKCHISCCGMPHEDRVRNPRGNTCNTVSASYNVACNHAELAHRAFRLGQEAGVVIGRANESQQLFEQFWQLHATVDSIDGAVRPLYDITNADTSRMNDWTPQSLQYLREQGIDTDVHAGQQSIVQQSIRAAQGVFGQRILRVRDAFVEFLEREGA